MKKKFFMTVFLFIGQLFFENDVFKLQKVFSTQRINVLIENELSLWPCGLFPKPLKEGIFSVSGIFIGDYLRNLTC
jgi:hypothetical protein